MKAVVYNFIIILSLVLIMTATLGSLAYSQSRDDCISSFNIEKIENLDHFLEENRIEKEALKGYYQCRAAALIDITECNNLSESRAQWCRQDFKKIVGFYSALFSNNGFSSEVFKNCFFGREMKRCKQFAEATLQADISVCSSKDNTCKAIIKLDAHLAHSRRDKDAIYYIQAIRDSDGENCLRIKSKELKRECKAYLSGDAAICREDKGYKKVRKIYCDKVTKNKKR